MPLPDHAPAGEVCDKMSTAETQSSCSKLVTFRGGTSALVYSTSRVVSALIPFFVRYSSTVVRKNCPLIRISNGMRSSSRSRRSLISVDSPIRLTSAGTCEHHVLAVRILSQLTGRNQEFPVLVANVEARISSGKARRHLRVCDFGFHGEIVLKVAYSGTQKCEAMVESQVANLELFFKRG
jgi:hypothetical protein